MHKGISITKLKQSILIILLLCSGFYFVPSFIIIFLNLLFITLSFVNIIGAKKSITLKRMNIFYFLYFISTFVSLLFNVNSFRMVLSTFQFILLNASILMINEKENEQIVNKVFKYLKILLIISVFYSCFLFIFGGLIYYPAEKYYMNYFLYPRFGQIVVGNINDLGYSSFFANPNLYGFYLLITTIYILCNEKNIRKKLFYLLILMMGVVLANSRGVYYGLILVLLLYLVFKINVKNRKYIIYLTCFIVPPLILIFFDKISNIILTINFNGRVEFWNILMNAFYKSPIIGNGFSSAKTILYNAFNTSVGSCNAYLNILTESGIVGALLFSVILLLLMKKLSSLSLTIKYDNSNSLIVSIIIILFVLLYYGIIENSLMTSECRHMFFLLFSMYIMNYYIEKEHK